ncbi:family 43 glycosylhydrolase [Lewinella sp. IMCC34183]|uniref:glycoside hydrolase family 43 protein n=1 Tax=Lewinella sp. IMCC34183 TaxID=2248762 RepID=UPI000E2444B1|nr:glycoside hydrolase family 43 protein [Lewinella sp. IMCC34183]
MPLLLLLLFAASLLPAQPPGSFANPLLEKGADPWIVQDGDQYHYCYSRGGSIWVRSATDVRELAGAPATRLWTPPEGTAYSHELWAPELHHIDDRWYVYVAADDGNNATHRMHVLVSAADSLAGPFRYAGKVSDPSDKWAIDGTVLEHGGKRYFVWSGWAGDANVSQNIYIAEMSSPTAIASERVLISRPDRAWEKRGSSAELPTINEGPQILQRDGTTHIIYSASGSWSDYYCLGRLTLTGDDPLDAAAWTKAPDPVFEGTEGVVSPGHCSFTRIGGQNWIVYHAVPAPGGGWSARYVKMQPFFWENNIPRFGVPVADGVLLPYPSVAPAE